MHFYSFLATKKSEAAKPEKSHRHTSVTDATRQDTGSKTVPWGHL